MTIKELRAFIEGKDENLEVVINKAPEQFSFALREPPKAEEPKQEAPAESKTE